MILSFDFLLQQGNSARAHFVLWFLLALLVLAQPKVELIPENTNKSRQNGCDSSSQQA